VSTVTSLEFPATEVADLAEHTLRAAQELTQVWSAGLAVSLAGPVEHQHAQVIEVAEVAWGRLTAVLEEDADRLCRTASAYQLAEQQAVRHLTAAEQRARARGDL
jgi:hypothetical protein